MNLNKLFENKDFLEKEIGFYTNKNQINLIQKNPELVLSHIEKSKHNFKFFKLNKENNEFSDWLIVILYYSLYHSALALIVNKNYTSKNHYATILILIKEYSISKDEIKLINDLAINKEDASLYSNLKKDRHDASYSTTIKFNKNIIEIYQNKVLSFINKVEEIIGNN